MEEKTLDLGLSMGEDVETVTASEWKASLKDDAAAPDLENQDDSSTKVLETTRKSEEPSDKPLKISDVVKDTPKEDDTALATAIYASMVRKGFIEEDETFDGSWDKIEEYQEKQQEALVQQLYQGIVANIPTKMQALVEAALNGVEEEKLDNIYKLSKEVQGDTPRATVYEYFKMKGLDADEIEDIIDTYEDKGELESKAEEFKPKIEGLAKKEAEKAIEQRRLEQEEMLKAQQAFYRSFRDHVTAQKLNPKKEKLVNEHLEQGENNKLKLVNKLEKAYKDPESLFNLIDFMTYFDEKTGKFNLDGYRNLETKKVNDLKTDLTKYMRKVSRSNSPLEEDEGVSNRFKLKI